MFRTISRLTLLMILGWLAISSEKPAVGIPSCSSIRTFYSDATFSKVVGYYDVNCTLPFVTQGGVHSNYCTVQPGYTCTPHPYGGCGASVTCSNGIQISGPSKGS